MIKGKAVYRSAWGLTLASVLLLAWLSLGVGINGPDGEPFDRIYLVIFAFGFFGALLARFRPRGMARALAAMALAQACVPAAAVIAGKHLSEASSLAEIVALFLGSAWLFRRAGPSTIS